MAHIRQSRPGSGLGVQVTVGEAFQVVASSLRRGRGGKVRARRVEVAPVALVDLRPRPLLQHSLGFRVWGPGFGVWGLGFRVGGLGFMVCGLGLGCGDEGFLELCHPLAQAHNLHCVEGLGFLVWG